MVLANIKDFNILKFCKFWYHFVDLSSLIQNLYKYPILASQKSHKLDFKKILKIDFKKPCQNRKKLKHHNFGIKIKILVI